MTGRAHVLAGFLAGLLTAPALAGCGDEAGYFPLEEGGTWGYRVTLEAAGAGTERAKSFASNLPRQALGDGQATPRVFHDGVVYYYAEQPDGIRRVAYRKPGGEIESLPPGDYVLKYPLEVGTRWRVPSRTYLRKDRVAYSVMSLVTAEVDLDYAIEKVDAVVRVPAGTFRDCVKVRGYGEAVVDLGPGYIPFTMVIESVEWFAPGVGLAKMIRRETSVPSMASDTTLVKELEVFDNGG